MLLAILLLYFQIPVSATDTVTGAPGVVATATKIHCKNLFLSESPTQVRPLANSASALSSPSSSPVESLAEVRSPLNSLPPIKSISPVQSKPQIVVKSEGQILHEKDGSLHTSTLIERATEKYRRKTGVRLVKPSQKIDQFLVDLDSIIKKASSHPRLLDQLKAILTYQFVIKPEEIPESYYAFQLRLLRERGYGNTELTPGMKTLLMEPIIADQKRSLEIWIEYLVSPDTEMYPVWLKYWIFTGMVKLSQYHHESGRFGHRDKGTVARFPELNREALSLVADDVIKYLNKKSLESFESFESLGHIQDSKPANPEILKLLPGLNFGKLYGQVLLTLGVAKEKSFVTNQGQWVVYKKGSDHRPLFQSIVGHNTGWCTAGEATAKEHLRGGDFHVYYSFDKNGLALIPRVGIRMESHNIAEVRGVGKEQNLDPQINESNVVTDKLKEFGPRADRYKKADHDMRLLTDIERKQITNIPLTKEDIGFLYEMEQPITGFGYQKDPRIKEIKSKRDMKSDLVEYFDRKYTRDEISITEKEFLSGQFKIHVGHLDLRLSMLPSNVTFPEVMFGNINIEYASIAREVKLPEILYGYLSIRNLITANGLTLPRIIYGHLYLPRLRTTEGLRLPEIIYGHLNLRNLESTQELILPNTLYGDLNLTGLKSLKGLKLPKIFRGILRTRHFSKKNKLSFFKQINPIAWVKKFF
jgi:hypothetical protein